MMMDPFVVERNLRVAMRCYAQATPAGEARDLPGLSVVSSGLPIAVFNSAMIAEPALENLNDFEQRLHLASMYFGSRAVPWSFWLCDELLPSAQRRRVRDILLGRRYRIVSEPAGMQTGRVAPPRRRLPELEVRRVSDAGTRLAFCDITSIVFDLAFPTSRQIYDREDLWQDPIRGYVGYLQGKAVSTAMIVAADGALGVYSVGTLPQHQRCGFAEALLRVSLADAAAAFGTEHTILQATRAGMRLYEKMGYRTVVHFTIYVSP